MQHQIPSGDILIHAGDFTSIGKVEEVKKFSEFLKTLDDKFQYKVVIAGEFKNTKIYYLLWFSWYLKSKYLITIFLVTISQLNPNCGH